MLAVGTKPIGEQAAMVGVSSVGIWELLDTRRWSLVSERFDAIKEAGAFSVAVLRDGTEVLCVFRQLLWLWLSQMEWEHELRACGGTRAAWGVATTHMISRNRLICR